MTAYHPALTKDMAATAAIAGLRTQLGRCRVSAAWAGLTVQQRATLCYAARLKPADYAHKALADMTSDEREAIRRALVELKRGLREFVAVDRAEWLHCKNNKTPPVGADGVSKSALV